MLDVNKAQCALVENYKLSKEKFLRLKNATIQYEKELHQPLKYIMMEALLGELELSFEKLELSIDLYSLEKEAEFNFVDKNIRNHCIISDIYDGYFCKNIFETDFKDLMIRLLKTKKVNRFFCALDSEIDLICYKTLVSLKSDYKIEIVVVVTPYLSIQLANKDGGRCDEYISLLKLADRTIQNEVSESDLHKLMINYSQIVIFIQNLKVSRMSNNFDYELLIHKQSKTIEFFSINKGSVIQLSHIKKKRTAIIIGKPDNKFAKAFADADSLEEYTTKIRDFIIRQASNGIDTILIRMINIFDIVSAETALELNNELNLGLKIITVGHYYEYEMSCYPAVSVIERHRKIVSQSTLNMYLFDKHMGQIDNCCRLFLYENCCKALCYFEFSSSQIFKSLCKYVDEVENLYNKIGEA